MPAPTTNLIKHLETLGLNPDDLNEDAIRVSYKKLALQWHPDRHNADPEEAKEKFIEVNEAYMALVEECKRRNKRKKPRKTDDSPSSRRPFWAGSGSTPSAATATSSTPSASSSRASHTTASTSSTTKETEIPARKPEDLRTAKPTRSRPAKSTASTSAKSSSANHATGRSDTRKEETNQSGDRGSSHSSSYSKHSHRTSSRTAHQSSRLPRMPDIRPDTDSDSSSEEDSLHECKHSHRNRHHDCGAAKGKKPSLGEDDYEFIDLGTPLQPLGTPKVLSSNKDWIFPLHLTLEDLYFGTTHRYRITRTLLSVPRSQTNTSADHGQAQTVHIDVSIGPGWGAGTRIRVPGGGNQRVDGSFQDIVFVVAETPHPRFSRSGDDLELPVRVPWVDEHPHPHPHPTRDGDDESMNSAETELPGRFKFRWGRWHQHTNLGRGEPEEDEVYVLGIDGEEYTLPIPRTLVEAADGTRIFGAGMPIRRNGKVVGKGDLIIRWEFAFPESDKLHRSRWQTLKDVMHLRFQV